MCFSFTHNNTMATWEDLLPSFHEPAWSKWKAPSPTTLSFPVRYYTSLSSSLVLFCTHTLITWLLGWVASLRAAIIPHTASEEKAQFHGTGKDTSQIEPLSASGKAKAQQNLVIWLFTFIDLLKERRFKGTCHVLLSFNGLLCYVEGIILNNNINAAVMWIELYWTTI